VAVAGWLADPEHWASLRERLVRAVAEHAARDPLAVGMPLEAARAALGLPDRRLVEALAAEPPGPPGGVTPGPPGPPGGVTPGPPGPPGGVRPGRAASGSLLAVRDGYVRAAASPAPPAPARGQRRSAQPSGAATESRPAPQALPARVADAVRSLRAELDAAPFRAPEAGRLRELGLDRKALAAAERAGLLLRITPELVLAPGADTHAARVLARLPQPFTTAQARQALDTTRRVAIPLLEYLDRGSVTQRLPDDRRMLRPG
jgi:selenocysteine-specific elongation factor